MKISLYDRVKSSLGFKPNRFWTGPTNSELVDQEELHIAIQETIDKLDIRDGDYAVYGVCLFGSVLRLQGKDSYRREPSDVDIYFWQKNPHSRKDRNHNMEWKISNALQSRFHFYGLPLDVTSFPMRPRENNRSGFVIPIEYPLYDNLTLIQKDKK